MVSATIHERLCIEFHEIVNFKIEEVQTVRNKQNIVICRKTD